MSERTLNFEPVLERTQEGEYLCVWKSHGVTYAIGCKPANHYAMPIAHAYDEIFTFCPYCSRRIKFRDSDA